MLTGMSLIFSMFHDLEDLQINWLIINDEDNNRQSRKWCNINLILVGVGGWSSIKLYHSTKLAMKGTVYTCMHNNYASLAGDRESYKINSRKLSWEIDHFEWEYYLDDGCEESREYRQAVVLEVVGDINHLEQPHDGEDTTPSRGRKTAGTPVHKDTVVPGQVQL